MIELSFQFNKVFQLTVNHDYFTNGKWADAAVLPDQETAQKLKKLNMLFRKEEAGFVILHDAAKKQALINQLKAEDYELNFFLIPNDYTYINYTDLPVDDVNKVAYFSTNDLKAIQPGKHVKMHHAEKVNEDSFETFTSSEIELDQESGQTFRLWNDKKELLTEKNIESASKNYIELTNQPSGRYYLEIDKKNSQTLIFFKGGLRNKPVAFVNVSLSSDMKKAIIEALEQGEETPHFSFELNFSSRATFWKYYVIPKYVKELDSTIVNDVEKKLAFSKPEACTLENGMNAYCFESDQAIPLSQLPKVKFQLKKKNGNDKGGRSLIDPLPIASTDRIVPVKDGGNKKIYSEIIVYL